MKFQESNELIKLWQQMLSDADELQRMKPELCNDSTDHLLLRYKGMVMENCAIKLQRALLKMGIIDERIMRN